MLKLYVDVQSSSDGNLHISIYIFMGLILDYITDGTKLTESWTECLIRKTIDQLFKTGIMYRGLNFMYSDM